MQYNMYIIITISSLLILLILFISLESYYISAFNGLNYFISLDFIQKPRSAFAHNPNNFNCYIGGIARKKYRVMFSERRRNAYTN